jgi:hypothetical protein
MIYRHGDLIIKSVRKIKGKKLKHNGSFVLAEGETTGHRHLVTVEKTIDLTVFGIGDIFYMSNSAPATVTHEEHKTLTLPAGDWVVEREQEKDWFTLSTRRVVD